MGTHAVIAPGVEAPQIIPLDPRLEVIKVVMIGGQPYYTLPEAAKRIGVAAVTVFRWVKGDSPAPAKICAVHDKISGSYYLHTESVTAIQLRRLQRL